MLTYLRSEQVVAAWAGRYSLAHTCLEPYGQITLVGSSFSYTDVCAQR